MKHADFVHLVRLSELASAENSQAYRRSVALFAALGYAWVLGCLLLGAGILVWVVTAMLHGSFRAGYIWGLLGGGGLVWTSLRALWCPLDAPEGVPVTPDEAPALFEALERIRRKIKGPPIHKVYLDDDFNASIRQTPRWGLFGGAVNHLTIGLPLLMTLDRPRFLAVLAHEYGHLRGGHGRFAAWVYRTRLSWARLDHAMRHDESAVAAATQAFLRWYFPRFSAKTFAMARQDEYEADRIASRLLGKDVMGAALIEIVVRGDWLHQQFWPAHWRAATDNALPIGPFAALGKQLARPLDTEFARGALRQALRRLSDVDDTHPVLRDRIEALEARKDLPAWSVKPAIGLLGPAAPKWIAHFDAQWRKDHATDWKQHHAYLGRVRARVEALSAQAARANAAECVELGNLTRRLDPHADVRVCYERALSLTPDHAEALRGLVQSLPRTDRDQRLTLLEKLYDSSVAHRWWASRAAVAELEAPSADGAWDEKALKTWRERMKQAEEAEARAWEELTESPFFQSITRHDLSEFELGELRAELAQYRPVTRAWLVRKQLKEFQYRRTYLLFVELPDLDDETRYELCRRLERQLDLPGIVLALWAGHDPTLGEIEQNAFEPVYLRAMS